VKPRNKIILCTTALPILTAAIARAQALKSPLAARTAGRPLSVVVSARAAATSSPTKSIRNKPNAAPAPAKQQGASSSKGEGTSLRILAAVQELRLLSKVAGRFGGVLLA
jgi:hypothetical protein